MIQELINAFNSTENTSFVAFEYVNRFGEKAGRLIQINTNYENALRKDLEIIPEVEYVQNEEYDRAIFITAQAELLKSAKMSLGIKDDSMNKTDIEKQANRSKGQIDAYVQIAKNIKYSIEKQQLYIFAKEVRKNVIEEGDYPETNKHKKTIAKDFIKKSMKSSKYRTYVITNVAEIKVNGDTIQLI